MAATAAIFSPIPKSLLLHFSNRTTAISATSNSDHKMMKTKTKKNKPSVLELKRAIGGTDLGDDDALRPSVKGSFTMMDLLTSTPIGQATESLIERKFRETSEWVMEQTESRQLAGQKTILVWCMKIFPLWLFLLLIASGGIRLPFDTPFLDNLLL